MNTYKNATAISVRNLTKIYKLYNRKKDRMKEALNPFGKKYSKPFYALKNVSFDLNRGEILGVVGRNGAGKSTLLEIITGVLSKTSGSVHIKGRISALLSLGIGFNPALTGVENVYLNGTLQGLSREEIDERLDDILAFAEIGSFAYQPMKTYSSGMIARLGFAVSINIDPDILIIDEALAVGDALFKRKCYARLENFMKQGKTIIIVSHSVSIISQLCTRAIFIDKGELLLEGLPGLVVAYYQKYLFAKKEDQPAVREETISINKDVQFKTEYEGQIKKADASVPETKTYRKTDPKKAKIADPYFVPNFIPKSTVEYKNHDVSIYDPVLLTTSGKKVNHIVTSDVYEYCFRVKFGLEAENVSVGFKITDEKGMEISSFNLERSNNTLKKVLRNDIYLFQFSFTCNLLPGNYYITDGVSCEMNGEKGFLNRIVDFFVFKVIKHKHLKHSGLVFLNQDVEITKE